jgi:hypothetical protein
MKSGSTQRENRGVTADFSRGWVGRDGRIRTDAAQSQRADYQQVTASFHKKIHKPAACAILSPATPQQTLIGLVVLAVGCGSSPTQPKPIAPANITSPSGSSLTLTCAATGQCSFVGPAVNTGVGCAINIKGSTRLLAGGDVEVGRVEWSLPAGRMVHPTETFTFESCCFTRSAVDASIGNRTTFTWDNVTC